MSGFGTGPFGLIPFGAGEDAPPPPHGRVYARLVATQGLATLAASPAGFATLAANRSGFVQLSPSGGFSTLQTD